MTSDAEVDQIQVSQYRHPKQVEQKRKFHRNWATPSFQNWKKKIIGNLI